MFDFFEKLFHSDLMPHGHCYLWRPELVWLHAISDGLIVLSYYFIPVALVYFSRKRKDLPFHWMFVMFGVFILGCGTTHLMEIWNIWHGTYRLAGILKAITAGASVATAIALLPLIPKAIALPSPSQLQSINEDLALKTEQIRALSADHLTRLEEERRHIAREVHDESGQALVAIKMALQVLALRLPEDRPELRKELDVLRQQVNESVGQLKDLARRLRPPTLDPLGLGKAIAQLGSEHQNRTGMTTHLKIDPELPRLPETVEIAIYRIAQEGLTNAIKHAEATQVWLQLHANEFGVEFSFRDDGRGFDPAAKHSGLGLLGMQERAAMLDSKVVISSKRDEGTELSVLIPWKVASLPG
jgi:signal transduction histidine kinase